MSLDRDFEAHPYSKDEERVAKWIVEHTGVGGGDDPIGFILSSLEYAVLERNIVQNVLKGRFKSSRENPIGGSRTEI